MNRRQAHTHLKQYHMLVHVLFPVQFQGIEDLPEWHRKWMMGSYKTAFFFMILKHRPIRNP